MVLTSRRLLKFDKKKVVDLTNGIDFHIDWLQFDKYLFSLKGFEGTEDNGNLSYHAILCCNDKPLCECVNHGVGNETEIKEVNPIAFANMKVMLPKIEKYKFSINGNEKNMNLSYVSDILAKTEIERRNRTIKGKINN